MRGCIVRKRRGSVKRRRGNHEISPSLVPLLPPTTNQTLILLASESVTSFISEMAMLCYLGYIQSKARWQHTSYTLGAHDVMRCDATRGRIIELNQTKPARLGSAHRLLMLILTNISMSRSSWLQTSLCTTCVHVRLRLILPLGLFQTQIFPKHYRMTCCITFIHIQQHLPALPPQYFYYNPSSNKLLIFLSKTFQPTHIHIPQWQEPNKTSEHLTFPGPW